MYAKVIFNHIYLSYRRWYNYIQMSVVATKYRYIVNCKYVSIVIHIEIERFKAILYREKLNR